ncbi:hypothetical protein [Clostridium beijerinckii]|uniref:hypothetical protein n=1 Tax=Clostridium beijerinckii TaxID=1520 RepID=UPI001F4880C2|nr:hypothetical protein [Clostridium beijerinckii]
MQNKRDNLDTIIINSFKNITASDDYNKKLMQKLHKKQLPDSKRNNLIPSYALIAAGLFIIFLSITSLQVHITNFESRFFDEAVVTEINQHSIINLIKQLGE